MAEYLIQDTTLDAIADAINAKTGGSSAMTPAEMVTNIAAIPSGGATITDGIVVKARNSSGRIVEVDFYGNAVHTSEFRVGQSARESWLPFAYLQTVNYKNEVTSIGEAAFLGCPLTKIEIPPTVASIGQLAFKGVGLSAISDPVYMPQTNFRINDYIFRDSKITRFIDFYSHNYATGTPHAFQNCTLLQEVQFGSVGYPCLGIETLTFSGCTQSGLTITIFCASSSVDTFVANTRNGATNATIIIKASEATEYNGTSYAAGDTILTSEVT